MPERDQVSESTSSSESRPAIFVQHLWHRYGQQSVLKDISFKVMSGEIFGFIGPNGAGKTTTIRILATLLEPFSGRVAIDGVDVMLDPEEVRRKIGYMPDHAGVYERLTLREYLTFFAHAYALKDPSVVDAALELTALTSLETRLVIDLSKGMKQRLQLARILLHDPKVLILDEPASDLDPRARIELRDLLLELRDLGKTIFLSSHILTELSDICTSVGILEHGELVLAGPIGQIAEQLEERSSRVSDAQLSSAQSLANTPVTAGGVEIPKAARKRLRLRVLGEPDAAIKLLHGGAGVLDVESLGGGQLLLHYSGDDQFIADTVRHLALHNVGVVGVEPERNELERIFLKVTRGERQ